MKNFFSPVGIKNLFNTDLLKNWSDVIASKIPTAIQYLRRQKKALKAIVIISTLFFIFKNPLESFFLENITSKYLLIEGESWISSAIVLILLVACICFLIVQFAFRKKRISWESLGFFFALFGVYVYYRINDHAPDTQFCFTAIDRVPFVKYFDVWIPLYILFFQKFYERRGNIDVGRQRNLVITGFFEDSSSTFDNEDSLRRSKFAQTIAVKINQTHTDRSFSIGIVAKWGKGKTVFMNFLREYLNPSNVEINGSQDNIIIDFNPWRSASADQILKDFFIELENELSKYDTTLTQLLKSYLDSLSEMSKSEVVKAVKKTTELIAEEQSLKNKYEQINRVIRNLKRRIIIFIDDVDRLNEAEIKEVLRIIRNTADFSMTFFVVAYDHKYVQSALSKDNNVSKHYLEKIFQLQIPLPSFMENILLQRLKDLIHVEEQKKLGNFELENALNYLQGSVTDKAILGNTNDNFIESYFRSLRDVIKFANSFNLVYNSKKEEIIIAEFLLLEMLRLKFPLVFEYLSESHNVNKAIERDVDDGHLKYNTNLLFADLEKTDLMNEEDKDLVRTTLVHLMGTTDKNNQVRSIKNINNHLLYFSYDLVGKVSLGELNKIRVDSDKHKFFDKIDEWFNNAETREDLIEILKRTSVYGSRMDFERTIEAYFFLSKHIARLPYWREELFGKANKINEIIKSYYAGEGNPFEVYSAFLKELMTDPDYSEVFRSNLAASFMALLFSDNGMNVLFKKEDLQNIIVTIFAHHLNRNKEITQETLNLYYNNFNQISKSNGLVESIDDLANDVFLDYITLNPSTYLNFIIDSAIKSRGNMDQSVLLLFRNNFRRFEDFIFGVHARFIAEKKDTEAILRLITFYLKFKANGFRLVETDLNTIEFFSDSSVTFVSSPTYQHLMKQQCKLVRWHPWTAHIVEENPEYMPAEFVAHAEHLSFEEEINGGEYFLTCSFNLKGIKKERIRSITLGLFVDDFCAVGLNEKWLEFDIKTHEENEHREYLLGLTDRVVYDAVNILDFKVTNATFDRTKMNKALPEGENNPYGLMYRIVIELINS